MKYALIILLGIVLFAACKKKSPQSSTYKCYTVDSIPPAPNTIDSGLTTRTSSQINEYEEENTFIDTVDDNGVKHVEYQTTTCEVWY
jgi:hypothetical protein